MKDFSFEQVQSELLDCVFENCPAQTVLDRIYALTGVPMIAFDLSFQLIARAFPRPFYLPGWEHMAREGKATEKMVLSYKYLDMEEKVFDSGGSVVILSADKYPTAFAVGCESGEEAKKPLGYFASVIEDNEPEKILRLNSLICSVIFSGAGGQEREISSPQLLRLIIRGKSPAADYMEAFTKKHKGPYAISLLTPSTAGFAAAAYIDSSINRNGEELISVIEDKILYILAWDQESAGQREWFEGVLRHFCLEYGYTAGLSDCFTRLELLPAAARQAEYALKLRPRYCSDSLIPFGPHYIDILCAMTLEADFNPNYQFSDIERLRASGLADPDSFLETLEIYLNNMQKIFLTAEKQGIHKNTVKYRIRRIEELLGLELKDSAVSERLGLELRLYRMYEQSRRENK